ncbi:MAG: hypothetical protein H9W82_13390 [Lactobacillus sp.]|nr:hypothetical protein [Lactobacillus sp.]
MIKEEALDLVRELRDYVKIIGSHNKHINEVAEKAVKLLEKEMEENK